MEKEKTNKVEDFDKKNQEVVEKMQHAPIKKQEKQKDINTMSKKELGRTANIKPKQDNNEEKPENKEQKIKENINKKVEEKSIPKKDTALSNVIGMHASKKHCMYLCNLIRGMNIDKAIKELELVISMKKAVPFKGEIPHRKGKMMSGRYPVKTAKLFIPVLRGLKGNAIVNGLDLDKTIIFTASASWASRPLRRDGVEAKRTNIILIAKENSKKIGNK